MRYAALAFLFGIVLAQVNSFWPAAYLINASIIVGVWLLGIGWHQRWLAFNYIGFAILGWAWLFINAAPILNWQLPAAYIGKTCIANGEIVSDPLHIGHRYKFTFLIDTLQCGNEVITLPTAQRVSLSWYTSPPHLKLARNGYWQLHLRLKPGWGKVNPGGFDSEKWLLAHKIHYVGYVVNHKQNYQKRSASAWVITHYLDQIRSQVKTYLHKQLNNIAGAHLLLAMLVGERTQLSTTAWQVLQATGTSHLMAISGLHVAMLAGLVGFLVLRLWRCSAWLCLRCPAPIAAVIAALIGAFSYSLLAGFSLPTQRALIMFLVIALAVICRRRWLPLSGLNIALWCLLLHDPLMTLTIGFWLSFIAVIVIAYGVHGYCQTSPWWKMTRVQWVMSWLLLPVTLWFFAKASLVSLFANAVAIAGISFIILPLGFLGLISTALSSTISQWCLQHSALLLDFLWQYLVWLSHISYAQWIHPITKLIVLLSASIGMVLLLAPRGWPLRWLGVFWLLPLYFLPLSTAPTYGNATITVLDVGQGLAAVVRTQHHTLLYDTGPRYSASHNAGQQIVVPYFISQGIQHISRIIVSHGDNDHSGGLVDIVRLLSVNSILTSEPQRLSVQADLCQAGQKWQWDGVQFTVLSPPLANHATKYWHDNDKSCVLRVQTRSASLLLTGDIEKKTEQYLIQHRAAQLASDIIIVPHHGSHTSSTAAFVNMVMPKVALFPVGYRNRFGFPHKDVLARYHAHNSATYLSWRCGAMTIQLDEKQQWVPTCWRQQHHAFWMVIDQPL